MFYVYDIEGLQFRGPMEALEQSRRVEKSEVAKELKLDDSLSQQEARPRSLAAASYERVVRGEGMVEPLVHIYQIMSSPVSTISPSISPIDAWSMLKDGNIRQLVVTNEKKVVIGVLSDRDILKHLIIDGDTIHMERNIAAADMIEDEVITTDSMSDIRQVARVMAFYHLDAMPVLENERLVGIVTRGDILRGFAENPKLNLWA